MTKISLLALASLLLVCGQAQTSDRVLRTELELDAPLEEVWDAWTTPEGIQSFFAPGCNVLLEVDGAYEIFFNPDGAPGERGAEDMRILALEPMRRLAFTWNAPPHIPTVRAQRTQVVLDFEAVDDSTTRLRFTHSGWGDGEDWDQAYTYFDEAWNRFVLPRLQYRFEVGAVDWADRPRGLPPVTDSMQVHLQEAR